MDFRLVPNRHDDGRERFGVFLRGGFPLLIVAGIQIFQRFLAFGFILDQLDKAVFLVVAFIDLSVDDRHALSSRFYCIFIDGRIRVGFTSCLCAGDFRFDLLSDGLKAACFLWGQMILDFNGFAGIDQLLQPDFILIGEMAVLPLFQQPLDFRIHLIQRLNIRSETLRDTGIAVLVGSILERLQFSACAVRQAFERIRPVGDDFVALFFSVRPDSQQTVQPLLCGLPVADKVAFRHAEEGQPFTAAIESLCGGVLPLLRCILHSLQRFARLLCTGYIIRQRDSTRNHCGGDGKPYGGRFTQDRKKSLPAATQALGAARFAYLCSKFSKGRGHRAHALRDLAQYQQYGTGCGGISRELNDLLPLGFVHGQELLQKLFRAVNETADGGIQVVADLLAEQQRRIFEVLQFALRGGVALVGFFGQSSIFLPCGGSRVLRP